MITSLKSKESTADERMSILSSEVMLDTPFVFGLISNVVALYLVCTKSRKDLTQYKKLLIIFLVSDLFYTVLQDLLKPIIVVSGDLFLIFSPGSIHSKVLLSTYCGCVSMSFVIISFNFVFRAMAISDKYYALSRLDWRKLVVISLFFIIQASVWGALTHTQFSYEESYEQPAREYFTSINRTYPNDPLNELIIFRGGSEGKSVSTGIIITIIYVEIVVGLSVAAIIASSVFIVKRLKSNAMSNSRRTFHKQLFVSLLVQLLIPCFLLYIPCGVFIVVPFFGLTASYTTPTWLLATVFSVYPIIDPLAIIFLICDYRTALVEMGKLVMMRIAPCPGGISRSTIAVSVNTVMTV